jgi:hypothetical protein
MTYFIEHDSQENIVHACADPTATITPLVNRVTFRKQDGSPMQDEQGRDLSPYGFPLVEPVGIDQATYESLVDGGLDNYTYDLTSGTVKRKQPVDQKTT